ncbi:hypothetical protein F511_10171 [Dorcoceras hygrometricum]|uniref:Secreted protein n=1 Tax=Dorcoceras hygrometricum TaxID=472368 RepID=A0A2Z7B8H2_9LAMI|nr:hypothetical protein F511_10171 [Dorcoceras hygrometricum]
MELGLDKLRDGCVGLLCLVVVLVEDCDARASGDTALSFPLCAEWLATTVHRLGVDASGWASRGEWVAPTNTTLTVDTYSVAVSIELLSPFSGIASAFYSCCSLLFYSCSPYWGLTPCPSGAWLFSLFVLFSGNPGFTAGRGFNPAGGAPGGG